MQQGVFFNEPVLRLNKVQTGDSLPQTLTRARKKKSFATSQRTRTRTRVQTPVQQLLNDGYKMSGWCAHRMQA